MPAPLIEVRGLHLDTLDGRALVRSLDVDLGRERVALVGRNGVGKSTLLEVLAGERAPRGGAVVQRGDVVRVPQDLAEPAGQSPGERRRRALDAAMGSGASVLLLDEPTEDLDLDGRSWLLEALDRWRGGLLVVSHDVELLERFSAFFVMEESGCHLVEGSLDDLLRARTEAARRAQEAYARALTAMERELAKDAQVRRRRQRKRAVGRLHELDRNQSRIRLNARRSTAQISQARVAGIADARIEARARWATAVRRALDVRLPLAEAVPSPGEGPRPAIVAEQLTVTAPDGTLVVEGLDLTVHRERVAVVGPNGAGKTTLLEVLGGRRTPRAGRVRCDPLRVGIIGQGAEDWRSDESLRERLARRADPDEVAATLVAHRFPLPLADRPLATLSPGERTRAALLALFDSRALEVLILDEPTRSLDLDGVAALTEALAAWRGGLVIASHDRRFLERLEPGRAVSL